MKHYVSLALLCIVNIFGNSSVDNEAAIEAELKKYQEQLVILGDKVSAQEERLTNLRKKIETSLNEIWDLNKQELKNLHKDPEIVEKEHQKFVEGLGRQLQESLRQACDTNDKTIKLDASPDIFIKDPSLEMLKFNGIRAIIEIALLADYVDEWQKCLNTIIRLSSEKSKLQEGN